QGLQPRPLLSSEAFNNEIEVHRIPAERHGIGVRGAKSCPGSIDALESASELPLTPDLAGLPISGTLQLRYSASSGFVFKGASGRPRWRGIQFADSIKPAAVR